MASVLARGNSGGGALAVCPCGTPLVSRHVVSTRGAVRGICTGQYGRPLPQPDGRPWFHNPVLCPRPLVGIFPLERLAAICLVSSLSKLAKGRRRNRHLARRAKEYSGCTRFTVSQYNRKLGMVRGGMGLRRLHVFYVVVHQARSLYRTTVSSRRAAHRNVLAPDRPRCSDERPTRLDPYHDDHGLYFGDWICIVAVPVSFVCWTPGEGVSARADDDSRERPVCRLRGPVGRDGAGRLLWVE